MLTNLATVQAIYEAFGKGDISTIMTHISDEVIWEAWADNSAQKAGVPWLQNRLGKNGVMEFFQVAGTIQFYDFQVLSLMDGGNQIAAEIILDVTLANGNRFQDEEMHLWSFDEEGKIIRMRHYTDTHKHMKAAGIL